MALRDVALVLGPVVFHGFEIPETIGFGGAQRLAVHDMPGGQRVVDVLGPLPADIAWSGIFGGPDATARARLLDTLRAQGQVLTLSWDAFFYPVVIRSFTATFHNAAWVPYRIGVTVIQDNAVAPPALLGGLTADAAGDAASADGFAAAAGVALTAVQTALATPSATMRGTAAYLAANSAAAAAAAQVQSAAADADATLQAYATNGLDGSSDIAGMIAAAGASANLYAAHAYLQRLAVNMTNAGT